MTAADPMFYQVFHRIGGGKRVAVLISAFFDESTDGDADNGLLSVSGYALDNDGLLGLIPEWQKMKADYRVPFFRMSDCNSGEGAFEHLSEAECDLCAREAIRIAKQHPLHGHSFVLDQTEYREILQNQGFDCDPYTFMVWSAYSHVNTWVRKNKPDYKMSLFFEDGVRRQII